MKKIILIIIIVAADIVAACDFLCVVYRYLVEMRISYFYLPLLSSVVCALHIFATTCFVTWKKGGLENLKRIGENGITWLKWSFEMAASIGLLIGIVVGVVVSLEISIFINTEILLCGVLDIISIFLFIGVMIFGTIIELSYEWED